MKILTEKEVSGMTGFSINTLRKWRSDGRGPGYIKIGHSVRYRPDMVEAWIAKHEKEVA